ncbi:hypothetical protein T484DRAFT_1950721 [Baffinella frigidus]|nr:hypothetical protein T484DRAFT_1950721 [Cryptophyta sp. CCMP2293]
MVAVYNTFGDAEAAVAPKGSTKKYVAAVAATWAVLLVAAVLIVGSENQAPARSVLAQRTQKLAFKPFVPDENVFENFDDGYDDSMKYTYDLAEEADYNQININSGVEGGTVEEGIADPYADQSARTEVPAAVYTQDAPYDQSVVGLGEKVFGVPFHEYTHAEEGEAVMGEEYVDTPFDTTINSVPEPNPSREWTSLDVAATENPNY